MALSEDVNDQAAAFAALAPVIPVVTLDDPELGPDLARTLIAAGLPVIEITLRTAGALRGMELIARDAPEAVIAAGTITRPEQIGEAVRAGAKLAVTPGTTPALADALAASGLPAMPGCQTASEALALAERGFRTLKFFPAVPAGGVAWLKSIAAPLPQLRFCPTGGVDAAGAPAFLTIPNVACVGGSWMVPRDALASRDWTKIGRLAAEAAALPRPVAA